MALPDEAKKISTSPPPFGQQSDSQLIDSFKQNPTDFARRISGQPKQLNRFWQLLERRFPTDPELVNAYDKAQNILGKIPAAAEPQPQAVPTAAPPVVTAEQLTGQEPAVPKNHINPENAPQIEAWLNNVKRSVGDLYSKEGYSTQRAGAYSRAFSGNLLAYLSMYRGELAKFYLDEGVHELLFSALGPIGDAMRAANAKNISLKMVWMKNPLNPMAIYYYMNSLPTQKAFELMYLPAKAAFGILAKGGAPFISKIYSPNYKNKNQTGLINIDEQLVFTPLLRSTQALDKLADTLDAKSGRTSDIFQMEDFTKNTNLEFTQALNELKKAKTMGQSSRIFGAQQKLNGLLDKYHQGIFKKILANTARRLRPNPHHPKDPFSFIFSLLGGAIWDGTIGLALNVVRVAANKLLSFIPGYQVLRAQLTRLFTANNVLNTLSASGRTFGSFMRGTFSPTTLSSGYLGYKLGSILFPGNPMAAAWTTGITGGLGAFYNTSLKMATNPYYFNQIHYSSNAQLLKNQGWVQQYNRAYALGDQAAINEGYLRGFRPSTLSKFAEFLHRNWALRLPFNGWVAADFLAPLMERLYGWSPATTHAVFVGADYLWQIKGPLLQKIGTFIADLPVVQRFVASVQFGITFPVQNWWFNMVYKATSFQQSLVGAIPTQWKMRTWAKVGQNFFNPGFFMGFGMVPWLSGIMPAPLAYVVAPIAGSLTWNLGAYALERIVPRGLASMSRINAVGWSGYLIGSLLDLVIPGAQVWLGPLLSGVFVGTDILLSLAGKSLIGILANGLASFVGFFNAAAAGAITASSITAIVSAVWAIGSITILTVFFAYTIYAGFWVPMIEEGTAQPQSTNFSINNQCAKTGPNQYNCCSNFAVTENIFSYQKLLEHKTDFSQTNLSIDLSSSTNVENNTDAWLGAQKLNYDPAGDAAIHLAFPNYAVNTTIPIVGGQGAGQAVVLTYLPTPSDQAQNLQQLMSTNYSVFASLRPFFDILTALAQEHDGQAHLVAEYKAQLKLMEARRDLIEGIINRLKAGNVASAATFADSYANPLTNPCPDPANCPEDKQQLKSLFDSWEQITNQYVTTLTNFQSQTNPDLTDYIADLEQTQTALNQQIELLPGIIDQIESVENQMTDADAAIISAPGFSFSSNPAETWRLLSTYFSDVFDASHEFYFIPSGTNYRVCLDLTYSGPVPGVEQTVCSTVSYQPSLWSPNTAFAKSCATFTP